MSRRGHVHGAVPVVLALALCACEGARTDAAPSQVTQADGRCGLASAAATLEATGGTAHDRVLACEALRRVLSFLAEQGVAAERRVDVEFRDTVTWSPSDTSAGEAAAMPGVEGPEATEAVTSGHGPGAGDRVVGLFDRRRGAVLMTSEATPWLRDFAYFGQVMSDELITTLLAHEISHAVARNLHGAGRHDRDTDLRVRRECAAYVVQLATMDQSVREAVLARYSTSRPETTRRDADDDGAINSLVLALAPEAFGVSCYRRFAGAAGGKAFLESLYSGAFRPWPVF